MKLRGKRDTYENDRADRRNELGEYDSLLGKISEESRKKYQKIIEKLKENGAEGVILGCTEIGLLIHQSDVSIPVFDTTEIHAKKAAEMALEGDV